MDLTSPVEPTETELMNFATGYGLQDMMTPKDAAEGYIEFEGMLYRPDVQFNTDGELVEMKTTRSGLKKYDVVGGELPDGWLKYMKAGCFIQGTDHYNLARLHLSERPSAKLVAETIFFDPEEIALNWEWILMRRDIYQYAIDNRELPSPYQYCADDTCWECRTCRYNLVCQAIQQTKGGN